MLVMSIYNMLSIHSLFLVLIVLDKQSQGFHAPRYTNPYLAMPYYIVRLKEYNFLSYSPN